MSLVTAPALLSATEALDAAIQLTTRRRRPHWAQGIGHGQATRMMVRITAIELQQDHWSRRLFRAYLLAVEQGWITLPQAT